MFGKFYIFIFCDLYYLNCFIKHDDCSTDTTVTKHIRPQIPNWCLPWQHWGFHRYWEVCSVAIETFRWSEFTMTFKHARVYSEGSQGWPQPGGLWSQECWIDFQCQQVTTEVSLNKVLNLFPNCSPGTMAEAATPVPVQSDQRCYKKEPPYLEFSCLIYCTDLWSIVISVVLWSKASGHSVPWLSL